MIENTLIPILYAIFMWLVILHTFEEIACDIFEFKAGRISMGRKKYLLAASGISTANLIVLVLLILKVPTGYYLGLFTTAVFGFFQAVVHTIGYIKEERKARGLGAGFYSSIPLAIAGLGTFVLLIQNI